MAVVPSRWENFPNTCIEAMGSGLPVIASRQGGMQEMIEDGRTGWLASKACSRELEEALGRALETPATRVAEMGRDAASEIRRLCDNKSVVAKHLELRSSLVSRGSKRSLSLPVNLPWAKRPLRDESPRRTPQSGNGKGLVVVVTCIDEGPFLDDCLQSLSRQTEKPVSVIVVGDESARKQTMEALGRAGCEGRQVVHKKGQGLASAKNAAIQSVLGSGFEPLGFAFLSARERLQPGFVAACESVLRWCPEVGIVSCWAQDLTDRKAAWIQPCPSFPYQWLSNEAASFSVARTEALREAGSFRPVMSQGYDDWDMFNALMAAGWVAVTIPEILVTRLGTIETNLDVSNKARGLMLERFPDLKARDGKEVDLLVMAATARTVRKDLFLSDHLAMARVVLRYPRDPALRALGRLKNKIARHIL
jgi:hypothetical protein